MVCNVITADKANRLFWLGRYAERVYISLHLLRRYYDKAIEGNASALDEYYSHLGLDCVGGDCADTQLSQLYDTTNPCSIATSISLTNDNAIVLRRDITSESLSYIQLSNVILEECATANEKNITKLQAITDYMLAFFGSIDERVFEESIRKILKIGRYIENLDMHIRFDYPFFRIAEVYNSLKDQLKSDFLLFDEFAFDRLDELLNEERYEARDKAYKQQVLACIGGAILV